MFPLMTIDVPMPAGTRTPGARPPIFMADGRPVQFFARDDDGQWFTAAPGDTWQKCGPPSG